MYAHIQKWGNSLGLRIPKHLAVLLRLQPGSKVMIEVENSRIIIQTPQYSLDTMLKEITAKNRHHQLLDDAQTGGEEW
jgi:antitoxin MazE